MRQPRFSSSLLGFSGLPCCLLILLAGILVPAVGVEIDVSITEAIWKMKFQVSDAQIGDASWRTADDDSDGIENAAEIAAGTNPFRADSTVKVTETNVVGDNVELSFLTVASKLYLVQAATALGGPWTPVAGAQVIGNGVTKTLPAPQADGPFYRVVVQDMDADNDGVADWAEVVAGYSPNNSYSKTPLTNDHTALAGALVTSNVITVTATKTTATQPPDASTAPVETGSITISRAGPLIFITITVPLQKSGTATEGTDYDALPDSVTFDGPTKQSAIVLTVNPKANAALQTNVTAIVKALAGGGYTVGAVASGSVVINPAGNATGTGLTAQYHHQSNSSYGPVTGANNDQLDVFAGTPEMSRTDATIDFLNGTNGWGTTAGPVGLSPASTNAAFSVRWTGQVLPKYSETYTFDFRSDDSAKVWVNGQLLIDRWVTQGATEYTNTIDLKAGVFYDIQIDYWNSASTAEARLYWWSPSQVKQIIPQNRLYPAPALANKFTAITSPLSAVGYVGVQFTFSVTSPNISGTKSYSLAPDSGPLPPGLSLDASTGVIVGAPTNDPPYTQGSKTYNVVINAKNDAAAGPTGSSVVDITIFATGAVTREIFAANGDKVSDMVLPTGAPEHDTIPTIDDGADYAANTGERLRGYLVPPKTGNYYFWLAANNAAELWISNDSESVNRVRRASVTSSTGEKTWSIGDTQKSEWLYFIAGKKYYFEVLRNTGSDADDYVAVGWCQDDIGTVPSTTAAPNPNGVTVVIPDGGSALQGYPLSGTVPSYIFQPYDYPSVATSTGTLYAANLGPQGAAVTKASGSANLRIDQSGSSAILHFNYGGLTSPRTGYHLHTDAFASHPQGEIVFDLDDIDAFHPELMTADGGYIWNFADGGTFTAAQLIGAIQQGKIYLNIHSVNYPGGEIRGNLVLIDGTQSPPDPALYPEPTSNLDVASDDAHAARFLNQASFGASPSDVAYVKTNGFAAWIDHQLAEEPSLSSSEVVANLTSDINNPYPSSLFTNAWWKYSITAPDQLRQRLAFALSEIMVISYQSDSSGPLQRNGRALADFYDNLLDSCLPVPGVADSGTFHGILKSVTLTPAMGIYLDMRGNQKGDPTLGRHPNENYAREIMQLFSVGLNRMWDDGKAVLDSNGNLVPTYAQPTILGLSALLTGWNYSQANQANGRAPTGFAPGANYLNPMTLVPAQHDLNAKLLLDNVVVPAATGRTPRVSISSITTGAPGAINTATRNGVKVGDSVTISGVVGGTYSTPINATHVVTAVIDDDSFEIGVDCSGTPNVAAANVTGATIISGHFPRVNVASVGTGTTASINTSGSHTLKVGDTVTISGVTGGTFPATAINGTHVVTTIVDSDTFRVTGLSCTTSPTSNTGTVASHVSVAGGVTTSGISPVSGSQSDSAGTGAGHPYDLYGQTDLHLAINNIVNNSNTAPFICRQLIQRFVTSDPDPGYLYRVVQKFKDNGSGVRGDMVAVIKQILLDGAARSTVAAQANPAFGKQREPVMRLTGPARAFPTIGYSGTYTQLSGVNSNRLRITTAQVNDFSPGFSLSLNFRDQNGDGQTTDDPFDNPTSTAYSIATTLGIASTMTDITSLSVGVGVPMTIAAAQPHGLTTGNAVTVSGVSGTFSSNPNGTFTATVSDANTLTIPITSSNPMQLTGVAVGNPCTVTTATPHGVPLGNLFTVTINGVNGGSFSSSINTTFTNTAISTGANTFTVPRNCTVTPTSFTTPRFVSNPCKITTVAPHGLTTGAAVTISGVSGGTFSPSISNATFTVTVVDATSFTIPVSCTAPSTVNTGSIVGGNTLDVPATGMVNVTYSQSAGSSTMTVNTAGPATNVAVPGTTVNIASITVGNPCTVTTANAHNLATGGTVTIAGVTDGAFGSAINGLFQATVTGSNSFTVPVDCTADASTGTTTKNISSRVYLHFLTQTAAGGAALPTSGIHNVLTNGSNLFTVSTTDTPATARAGNVLIPRITTSYTPESSNTIVKFNNNVNHNLLVGATLWVDVPVVSNPLRDAEYSITQIIDEDHFRTSYLPVDQNGGTYPKPSGSNNNITLWPLVPPPLGRSGNVRVNQSTFAIGGTDGALSQTPMNAPTVFNFFLPNYRYPGGLANNNIDSPEFQLTTDTNVVNLTNSITNMFIGTGGSNSNLNGLSSFNNGNGTIVVDIASTVPGFVNYMTPADTSEAGIPGLVDKLAKLLVGAPLTTETRNTIISFVNHKNGSNVLDYLPYTTPTNVQMRDRVRAVIHLIITSAEYAAQK